MDPAIKTAVLWTIGLYSAGAFALAAWAGRRIASVEDYALAGRRLPLWLAAPTLFATWFGAGTMMTATDEVRATGLSAATLDPLGAGLCLILAGALLAKPLWEMKLTTLSDFYRSRYGSRTELWSALLMVPSYFGWIAAQFVVLAEMLAYFADLPIPLGLTIVAVVGVGYTLLGGMWAVTLTDTAQMVVTLIGLVVLAVSVLGSFGEDPLSGARVLWAQTAEEHRALVAPSFGVWIGVLAAGALGNLPMQDVAQRIFAARSANTARAACYLAGGGYLVFGAVPVILGLAAAQLGAGGESTLAWLASRFLSPWAVAAFVVMLLSVVLSTIDSAILAPATVLAHNVRFSRGDERGEAPTPETLQRHRLAVVLVGGIGLGTAFAGESAYSLLESAYELGLVSLLVPLGFGFMKRRSERAALAAMGVGTATWAVHLGFGVEGFAGVESLTVALVCAGVAAIVQFGVTRLAPA